jgi:hypothetical protein
MNMLLHFNPEEGREDISESTTGIENLPKNSNDDGIRVVYFATYKYLTVKSSIFPHPQIHKYTQMSADGKTHNHICHILIYRRKHSSILDVRTFKTAEYHTDHYPPV